MRILVAGWHGQVALALSAAAARRADVVAYAVGRPALDLCDRPSVGRTLFGIAPDVIITGRNYEGAARAEDNLDHPALRALAGTYHAGELTDKDWICGTPTVLRAIRAMADLRRAAGGAE